MLLGAVAVLLVALLLAPQFLFDCEQTRHA